MKNITKILSVALVAMMVLSLSAVALADTPSVYIPKKLAKLLDASLDDFQIPTLKTKVTGLQGMKDKAGKPIMSTTCKDKYTGEYVQAKGITEDSVMQFQFSEKLDWFGTTLSALDGGWTNIELDETGYGELEVGELHHQIPRWGNFQGGKDYGAYSETFEFENTGKCVKVTVTLKDSEDFFRTGMEGGVMSITFNKVNVQLDSKNETATTDVWYVSHVSAKYPEGNYIIGVDTEWRNDAKANLASYKISYAVAEDQIYQITYAPNTTSVAEVRTYVSWAKRSTIDYANIADVTGEVCDNYLPSSNAGNTSIHHYTADEAIFGQFFKSRADWENGSAHANSGSGNKLNKWYKNNGQDWLTPRWNNGAQVRNIKKGTTSFKSPRVY